MSQSVGKNVYSSPKHYLFDQKMFYKSKLKRLDHLCLIHVPPISKTDGPKRKQEEYVIIALHVYSPPKSVGLFMEATVTIILCVCDFTKASTKESTDWKFGKPEAAVPVLQ